MFNLFYLRFCFWPDVCGGNFSFKICGVVPWRGGVRNIIVLHTHTHYTGCPTTYQTPQFFNNSKTNEDIATKFEQEYSDRCRCKSIGRWGTLNWICPAGWSDMPHVTLQHGWNSVLFRRPRYFEGTLATSLDRFNAASLFLMGISERESLPNKPRNIEALKANLTKEIQAVTADVLAKTFQNMALRVPSCLDANVGHFQHMLWCRHISHTTNVLLLKFRYNFFIDVRMIKEMLGSVGSGTLSQPLLKTVLFTQPSHSTPSWTESDLRLLCFIPVHQHALSFPIRFSRWRIESFYIVFPYSLKERVKQGYFSGCLTMHKMLLPK